MIMALGSQILVWRKKEEEYHGFPELVFQYEILWAGKLKTGRNTVLQFRKHPVRPLFSGNF